MPRAETERLYNTFVGGMITEASPLTYPPNSSFAESNCLLFRKGNRTRRNGVDYEDGYTLAGPVATGGVAGVAFYQYRWQAPSLYGDLNFLVTQIGNLLYFWDMSQGSTLSTNQLPFTISLDTFAGSLGSSLAQVTGSRVQMASGNGFLFVVGQYIDPFYVSYDRTTNSISTQVITIQIRDFTGVQDGYAPDFCPPVLTTQHQYNLLNQGWQTPNTNTPTSSGVNNDPIAFYYQKLKVYPPNSQQWWVARLTGDEDGIPAGDFDPILLSKTFDGTSLAPKGSYILDAFNQDRSSVSGIPGIPVVTVPERPVSVAFFSGRVWYVCQNTVYFSQVLNPADVSNAGHCYQQADPTSQNISDLVATDGGYVPIPEMTFGLRLQFAGNGVLVFGDNGIWFITGTTGGFTATAYMTVQVSPIGISAPDSVVVADRDVYYWSKAGIEVLTPNTSAFISMTGGFQRQNISLKTIQTYYVSDIPAAAKGDAMGQYDPNTMTIQWWWNSQPGNGLDTISDNTMLYDTCLNLDLTLNAFYPWSVSSNDSTPYIIGVFTTPELNQVDTAFEVTVNSGMENVTINSGATEVVIDEFTTQVQEAFLKYMYLVPVTGGFQFTFGIFSNNTQFTDWQTFDPQNVGFTYNSYVISGYEILQDAMRKKQTPYITCLFGKIENELLLQPDGGYKPDITGSCTFQTMWDWANTSTANMWSTAIEAYRIIRYPQFNPDNLTFDNGYSVIATKNKVRGTGRAIQFQFSNDSVNSNFNLLGWAVDYVGNTKP